MNRERIYQALRCRLNFGPSLVKRNVLGRDVKVRFGVVPEKPDYDEAWTYYLISQSSVMFDVGCNVGWCLLLACIDNPERRIVAFDANPKAMIAAGETLFLNGYAEQVQFVLGFTSNVEKEKVDFFTVGTGSAGSKFRSVAQAASKKNSFFEVQTITLDKIAEKLGIIPDFMKMDIEGAEGEALEGAKKIGAQRKTKFLIEMHATAELSMAANGDRILKWCRELGYDAYFLKDHKRITNSDSFAHRGRCHLFLQPAGWEYPKPLMHLQEGDGIEKVQSFLK